MKLQGGWGSGDTEEKEKEVGNGPPMQRSGSRGPKATATVTLRRRGGEAAAAINGNRDTKVGGLWGWRDGSLILADSEVTVGCDCRNVKCAIGNG